MRIAEIIMMLTLIDGGYGFFKSHCGRLSDGWDPPWEIALLAEALCESSTS